VDDIPRFASLPFLCEGVLLHHPFALGFFPQPEERVVFNAAFMFGGLLPFGIVTPSR
jgi:hypothetical protein